MNIPKLFSRFVFLIVVFFLLSYADNNICRFKTQNTKEWRPTAWYDDKKKIKINETRDLNNLLHNDNNVDDDDDNEDGSR